MKKALALLLSFLMVFSVCTPAFATEKTYTPSTTGSDIPVIIIYGDGEAIRDKDDNIIFSFSDLSTILGGSEDGAVGEAVENILYPFLLEGVLNDDWDNYYAALYDEIGELFADVRFDENGEKNNETDISGWCRWKMWENTTIDYKERNGSYSHRDYIFWYDWRQDPVLVADEFHRYVEDIKRVTKSDEVSIICKCLGNSVVTAYLDKYGADGIHGISFAASVSKGAEIISDSISGKFKIDGNAIARLLNDMNAQGRTDIDDFALSTIRFLDNSGILDGVVGVTKEYLYYKIVKGVTSALALSTFFTWPSYWACVSYDDYETALEYVFGEEGSELREKYAGLIAKTDYYNYNVKKDIDQIMLDTKAAGVNVCILSKYGIQLAPICESRNEIADELVSTKNSSYGATTATVYTTFSDEYINNRIAEGKGKYISPDKQIDASTCLFPDYTWFIKGLSHMSYPALEDGILFTTATADRQLTIDDFSWSQFIVANINEERSEEYGWTDYDFEVMNEQNCHNETWSADASTDEPDTFLGKIRSFLVTYYEWLCDFFTFVIKKMKEA